MGNSLHGGDPQAALIDFLIFYCLQIAIVVAMSSLVVSWHIARTSLRRIRQR